jgi:hypothetical protein
MSTAMRIFASCDNYLGGENRAWAKFCNKSCGGAGPQLAAAGLGLRQARPFAVTARTINPKPSRVLLKLRPVEKAAGSSLRL